MFSDNMKIAYVTTYDPLNITNWSGIGYYIARALKNQSADIEYIGPLNEYSSFFIEFKQLIYRKIFNKGFQAERDPLVLKKYSEQVSQQLINIDADIVFSPSSLPLSYLECRQPIVFWTDSNFAAMLDFYPGFSNLCQATIKNGNRAEQATLTRSRLAFYASDWAAQTAQQSYQVDHSKVKVAPFGANLQTVWSFNEIKNIVKSRRKDRCQLLFLGVDWLRKGGDTAIKVVDALNNQGLKADLHIAGCDPMIDGPMPDFIKPHGFLNKSDPKDLAQITRLLAESHFLFLPSRAECFGIVFCEASAFGLPSLATRVGGIPTAVRDNINGKTFSLDADIQQYCHYISMLMSDFSLYQELALSSFNEYSTRLNWTVAGKTVMDLLEAHCL